MPPVDPAPWQTGIGRETYLRHVRDIKANDVAIKQALRDAASHADDLVRAILPDETFSETVGRAQYAQHAFQLRSVQADLWGRVSETTLRHIDVSARIASHGTMLIAQVLSRALGDTSLGASFLFSARNTVETLRSRFINDIDLSPTVYRNNALANRWVDRAVNRGILLGKSAREIASDVKSLIRPDVPGGVSYAAQRLGRTELNNAFHETTRRTVADQPWMLGVKWELSGSHGRPDPCDDYSHEDSDDLGPGVFAPDNVPDKPHPQCLCYTTSVSVEPAEFRKQYLSGAYDSYLSSVN